MGLPAGRCRFRLPDRLLDVWALISRMSVVFRELERRVKRSVSFEPCLPRRVKEPPSGPGWIHEIKHDGFRILAQKHGGRVRLITRNGYDFTERYPLIVAAVISLPAESCILDGECIVVNEDGVAVFDILR
jgi:bifunctional non-homologous end joining protein LigD